MKLLVGNWCPGPDEKGLSVYDYNAKDGTLSFKKNIETDAGISFLGQGSNENIVYATNETDAVENGIFYNQVLTLNVSDPSEIPFIINRVSSLGPNPTWICEDGTGKYVLVSHHGGFFHTCTVIRNKNGELKEEIVFDKPHVVLIRLKPDGSYSEAVDAYHPQINKRYYFGQMSRSHSIHKASSSNIFFVCDKGLDAIFSLAIDYESEKIIEYDNISVGNKEAPRYGVVHMTKPIFYANMEGSTNVYAFNYDHFGHMTIKQTLDILPNKTCDTVMPSDIIFNPSGDYLYVGLRGENVIAIIALDENGYMTLKKVVKNEDGSPNTMRFSPDGRFLFVTNIFEKVITRFTVENDSNLKYDGIVAHDNCPASMLFI